MGYKLHEYRCGRRVRDRDPAPRASGAGKNIAIFAAKLVVTAACFWYAMALNRDVKDMSVGSVIVAHQIGRR